MSVEPQQEEQKSFPITEAKSLVSNGDEAGALAVLEKAAENGNVMACFDAGFMMIKGIGRKEDLLGGLKLMEKGKKLVEGEEDMSWKSDGSVTEMLAPQTLDLSCLLLIHNHIFSRTIFQTSLP